MQDREVDALLLKLRLLSCLFLISILFRRVFSLFACFMFGASLLLLEAGKAKSSDFDQLRGRILSVLDDT